MARRGPVRSAVAPCAGRDRSAFHRVGRSLPACVSTHLSASCVRSYYVSVCHAASRANVRRRSSVRRRARRTPRGAPARGGGPVASVGMACKRRSGRAEPERDHQPQIRSSVGASDQITGRPMRRTHGRLFTGASPVVQGHPNRSQFLQSTYDNPSAIMT